MSDVKDKLTPSHYHELLDRIHVLTNTIDTHITQHPVCKLEKHINKKVNKAVDLLYEAYQLTGQLMVEKYDKN